MMGSTISVGATCLALAIPLVLVLVCIITADGRKNPTVDTWDNGLATVRTDNFNPDVKLDVSQVEAGSPVTR